MQVLFYTRPDYLKNPAGDTVQMLATGQGLRNLGIGIAISADPNLLLDSFDLVHIFNITRIKESYMFFLNAQKQKKKIVISPIYWNPRSYLQRAEAKPTDLAVWNHLQPMRKRLLRECDLLLPNAESEMAMIKEDFPDPAPYAVIPNGFPDAFIHADPALIREYVPSLPTEFILSVARISPRKNQHWLAKTCRDLGLPLVLVGPNNDQKYYNLVRSFSNVTYLGILQGPLLASAYAAAKVHALPSWFETPGLSSLEAGACGIVVLSTDQGSTREYFKDLAVYINPLDEMSLSAKLKQALSWPPLPLTEYIQKNYPWSKVAQMTLNAYHTIVRSC